MNTVNDVYNIYLSI